MAAAATAATKSELATLINGLAGFTDADKAKAVAELTDQGYRSLYDVTDEVVKKLTLPEGSKSALIRQLNTKKVAEVPASGEKQTISDEDLIAMKSYVKAGIAEKKFSWDVPDPNSKPLIDTDGETYTWSPPDTSQWVAAQIVELVEHNQLQFALLAGQRDPTETLQRSAHAALCLKGTTGWRDIISHPNKTFERSVAAFKGSDYIKTHQDVAASLSISGKTDGIVASYSGHVETAIALQKGRVAQDEKFSVVTKVTCNSCSLNLTDHVAIRPEIVQEFADAVNDGTTNSLQKYAKVVQLFEKYGMFYVRQCDLGVQATGTNTLTSTFEFDAFSLAGSIQSGATLSSLTGGGAVEAGFSGSRETQQTAKSVTENLKITVQGATVAPGPKFLSSIAPSAGNPKRWAVINVREIVSIVDLFPKDLQDKLDALSSPWICRTAKATSGTTGHPSITIDHNVITSQLGSGFTVIGGGATVNYSGSGNLLVESRPTFDKNNTLTGWYASSKDHRKHCPATITAYAICLKPKDSTIVLDVKVLESTTHKAEGHGDINIKQYEVRQKFPGYTLLSGGGSCNYSGPGRLLTMSAPITAEISRDLTGWEVRAKDHIESSLGRTSVYAIALKDFPLLETRVRVQSSRSARSQYPSVTNTPSITGQTVCGGGAHAFSSAGHGQLLTESAPVIDAETGAPVAWTAKSKDHELADVGSLCAYTVYFDLVPVSN